MVIPERSHPPQPTCLSNLPLLLQSGLPHFAQHSSSILSKLLFLLCVQSLPACAQAHIWRGAIRQGSHMVKYILKLHECQAPPTNLPEREMNHGDKTIGICLQLAYYKCHIKYSLICKICSAMIVFVCSTATEIWRHTWFIHIHGARGRETIV